MKPTFVIASAVGIVLAVGLIFFYGIGPIVDAVAAVGWGALVVTLVRVGETSGAGVAWWLLLPERPAHLLRICVLLRWVRESINVLLPVAQVGGDVAGARLLTFTGISGGMAGASVLVDLLIQTATQVVFTLIGLALLVSAGGADGLVRWIAIGLAVLTPALAGFFLALRYGGVRLAEAALARFAGSADWAILGGLAQLHDRLQDIFRRPAAAWAAVALHMAIWFFGVFEVWVALRFMGHPVSYATALLIESLGHAVRGAAFMVPGAIGVQEGGLVALCAVFGIPAPVAVALSLVKRLPEVALGIPGLMIWQTLESRHLLAGRRSVAGGTQAAGK
ncbi:MAG TPA: lysylphosphatidylglycerol synthase domain-containing protein [Lichenihabitans sp.]|jgi:putative membrane protein|nr:lysylphosphatidylglycerol synthase domain-containing protein [Lichenihabitans sp.]